MPARHLPQQRRLKTGKKLCRPPREPSQLNSADLAGRSGLARTPCPISGPGIRHPACPPVRHLTPDNNSGSFLGLPPPARHTRSHPAHPLPGTPDLSRALPLGTPAISTRPPPAHPSYRPGQTASSVRTAEAEDIRKNFNKILKNLPVSYSRPNRPVFRQPEAKNDRGIRYCHQKPKQGARKISRGGRKIPSAVNNLTINLYICDIVFKPH